MTELLKQPQYQPYGVLDQVLSIFAGTKGYLDNLPVARVLPFEKALLRHFHDEHPELVDELGRSGKIGDELEAKLRKVIAAFKEHFVREQETATQEQPKPESAGTPEADEGGDAVGATPGAGATAAGAGQ
jgi:F-type H+-transporting ATPase subunit alpha